MKVSDQITQADQKYNADAQKRIQLIKKSSEQQVEEAKKQGRTKLERVEEQNQEWLNRANSAYDKKLSELDEQLQMSKERLQKEQKVLEARQTDVVDQAQDRFTTRYNQQQDIFNNHMEEYNEKGSLLTKEMAINQQQQVYDLNQKYNMQKADISNSGRKKVEDEKSLFERKKIESEKFHERQLREKEVQQSREVNKKTARHNADMKKLEGLHQKEFKMQETIFRNQLKEAFKNFEQKYLKITTEHQKTLDHLKTLAESSIQEAKNSIAFQKDLYLDKGEDPFYRMTTLDHEITDQETYYELKIPMSIHEKDYVTLSGKDRTLRLNYGRGYQDQMKGENSLNKYSKVESYNKEFSVPDIINLDNVSKKYEENLLIFKIPKG